MIIYVFIVLAILVAMFLIVAALQPSDYRVSRSIVIAPPSSVPFGYVNDVHRWLEMSPYAKMDRAARYTFEGPADGVGAVLAWVGSAKIGAGRMTLTDSRVNEPVRLKLEFNKPFVSAGVAEFKFHLQGSQTAVTWTMTGQKIFPMKAMGLVISMDKMIGAQFAEGLAPLKTLSEHPVN